MFSNSATCPGCILAPCVGSHSVRLCLFWIRQIQEVQSLMGNLEKTDRQSVHCEYWAGHDWSCMTVTFSSPTSLYKSVVMVLTISVDGLTSSPFSFEWFLNFYSLQTPCYGCPDIMAGGEGEGVMSLWLIVFFGWCLPNQFWARLVPGQEEAGWVQWRKPGGLLPDNGGSQAVDNPPSPPLPKLWHQLVFNPEGDVAC